MVETHQAARRKAGDGSKQKTRDPALEIGPLVHLIASVGDLRCVIKDTSHRYLYVNQAWLTCYGYADPSQVLGRTASEIYPKWRARRTMAEERQILESGMVFDYEEFSLNADGQPERWRTMKGPWVRRGKVLGIANISVHLTSGKALESRGDEVPELVDQLARRACDKVKISELARQLGMSTRTFERRFRQLTHESPRQFRMRCKIATAKQMLRGDNAIASVAEACGFRDQSHFTKSFRAHLGVSPGKFQKAAHEITLHGSKETDREPVLRAFHQSGLAGAVLRR